MLLTPLLGIIASVASVTVGGPSLISSVRDAEVIVVGSVREKRYVVLDEERPRITHRRKMAYTDHEFVLHESWKGGLKRGELLRFRLPGGKLSDSTSMSISGVPLLAKGQHLVAFLGRGIGPRSAGVWRLRGYASIEDGKAFGELGDGESLESFERRVRTLVDSLATPSGGR